MAVIVLSNLSTALTYVDSCRNLATPNEVYIINKTLSGDNCLNISSSYITLNGNYSTFNYRILTSNATNIYGISINASNVVINNTFVNNSYYPYFINNSHNSTIVNSFSWNNRPNGTGFFVHNSDNMTFRNINATAHTSSTGALSGSMRFYSSNNLLLEYVNTTSGILVNKSINFVMNYSKNILGGIFIDNVTNVLVQNNNYTSIGVVVGGYQLLSSNNISIFNGWAKALQSGSNPIRITSSNNIIVNGTYLDGNSVNCIAVIRGSNISINQSFMMVSSGSVTCFDVSAPSTNILLENSIIRNTGGTTAFNVLGQNVTIRNINSTAGAFILSTTTTSKNILVKNISHTSTGTNNQGVVSVAGNNITVTDVSYIFYGRNVTMFNILPDANNMYFNNIAGLNNLTNVNNSNVNSKGIVLNRYRNINITFNNISFEILYNVFNSSMINVTNIKIMNSNMIAHNNISSFNFNTTKNSYVYNITIINSTIRGLQNITYLNYVNRPIIWLYNSRLNI